MKREAIGHSKMKRLCRRLNIDLYVAVGILETIWHVTAIEAMQGDLGKLSNEAIALAIDYKGDENQLIDSLIATGWLDTAPLPVRLIVHDWSEHCNDAIHLKLARAHLYFIDGSRPKISRLSEQERKRLTDWFDQNPYTKDMRTDQESVRTDFAANFLSVRTNGRSVRTNGRSVRTACAQNSDPCALPIPKPIPLDSYTLQGGVGGDLFSETETETEPLAKPARLKRKESKEPKTELDASLETAAQLIWNKHPAPRRCGLAQVSKNLRAIVGKLPEAERLPKLRSIVRTHRGWCESEQWQKDDGEFAKGLDNWLAPTMGRFDTPAPAGIAVKASYESDYAESTKAWEARMAAEAATRRGGS